MFQTKLANKNSYMVSIGKKRLKLAELQESDEETRNFRAKSLERWEDINKVLHHLFLFKIIRIELISRHHDNLLAGYFGIKKTKKLIVENIF